MKKLFAFLLLAVGLALIPIVAHATVTTPTLSVSFVCSGSVGPYPFSFPITDATAMQVTQNGIVLATTTYTIVPVNNNYTNGGSVTLNSACSTGSLVLARVTPVTQTTVYTDNMPVPMKTFERSLDKLTEIEQEQNVNLATSINGTDVESPNFGSLPAAQSGYVNGVWQYDGSNISVEVPVPSGFCVGNPSTCNITGNLNVTGTVAATTLNAATNGVYTNIQMNTTSTSLLNGLNPGNEFNATQGANFGTEAMTAGEMIPSTSTVLQGEALGAYANNSSTTTYGMGAYLVSRCTANGTACWGADIVSSAAQYLTSGLTITGLEVDSGGQSAATAFNGIVGITSVLGGTAGGSWHLGNAYQAGTNSSVRQWNFGYTTTNGRIYSSAFVSGAACDGTTNSGWLGQGATCGSQGLQFNAFNAGAASGGYINSDYLGNIVVTPNTGQNLNVLGGITAIGVGQIGTQTTQYGQFQINNPVGTAAELLTLETTLSSPSGAKSIDWRSSGSIFGQIDVRYTSPNAAMCFGHLYAGGYQTTDLLCINGTGAPSGTAVHGSSSTTFQGSDGTGTSGYLAKFAADGSITNGVLPPLVATLTTTSATSDNVTVTGMTSTGHCHLEATNASAATNIATTYVSAKTTNQITVTHTATASMTYDVMCTAY